MADPVLLEILEKHKAEYHTQHRLLEQAKSSAKEIEVMIQANRRRTEHDFRCWQRRKQFGAVEQDGELSLDQQRALTREAAMNYFFDEVLI